MYVPVSAVSLGIMSRGFNRCSSRYGVGLLKAEDVLNSKSEASGGGAAHVEEGRCDLVTGDPTPSVTKSSRSSAARVAATKKHPSSGLD